MELFKQSVTPLILYFSFVCNTIINCWDFLVYKSLLIISLLQIKIYNTF